MASQRFRTVEEIGHIAWINMNRSIAYADPRLFRFDLSQVEDMAGFCRITGEDPEFIRKLGQDAKKSGAAEKWTHVEKGVETTDDPLLYRTIKSTALNIESSMTLSYYDETTRLGRGPQWDGSSCAYDVGFAAGIHLNAGLLQVDQIKPSEILKLSHSSQALLHILSLNLENATQQQINSYRDVLREQLLLEIAPVTWDDHLASSPRSKTKPTTDVQPQPSQTGTDAYQQVSEVLKRLLFKLPQLSWTVTGASRRCSDKGWRRISPYEVVSSVIVYVQSATSRVTLQQKDLSTALTNHFNMFRQDESDKPCRKGTACPNHPNHQHVTHVDKVVDRLPPRMMIEFVTADQGDMCTKSLCDHKGVFENIKIKHIVDEKTLRARYRPIGAIFMVSADHYILRWDIQSRSSSDPSILHMDSIGNDFKEAKGFWHGLDTKDAIYAHKNSKGKKVSVQTAAVVTHVFYQQIDLISR